MKGGIQLDEYMYKRILVPLDGSQRAERILPHVRQLVDSYWLHQEPQKNYP
jgi:nucleotide-binding universal stress UspA family protein